jgi:DNA-binding transcriptional ArsR family regulator
MHSTAKKQELIYECKDYDIPLEAEVLNYIENMEEKLSKFQQSELQYFFDYDVSTFNGVGNIIFWAILRSYPQIYSVQEIINTIKQLEDFELASYIVKPILEQNSNKPIEKICDWEQVQTNLKEMTILVQDANINNESFKEKIIECIGNVQETKERYCLMLKQFYEKAYIQVEELLIKKSIELQEEHKKLFHENPKKFSSELLKTDYEKITAVYNIHVSFIGYCRIEGWTCNKDDEMWILLGGFRNRYFGDEYEKEKIQMLFKALSDKNRLDIIDLLGERDWYVYELAEKLGMSAATISYHLGLLYEFNIVKFQRNDHRMYYSLNKVKFKELFDNATKRLFHK